jgi:hypothetical protein
MRAWRWRAALVAAALTCVVPSARAQHPEQAVASAVQAYQNLDYEAAATLLRRALAIQPPDPDTIPAALRIKALTYLAASDFYRGHRDSADVAFRRLVRADPRYRPDPIIFPPEVTAVFETARRATKAVVVEAPADTTLRLGHDNYDMRLYASSFHEIVVALEREDGRFLKGIYVGPIGDSLDLRWNGLDSTNAPAGDGRFVLTVTSRPTAGGEVVRVLRFPLEVRATHPDTLAWPALPDTAILPEHALPGPAYRSVGGGLLGGLAAIVLPSVLASGSHPSGGRYLVAGALSVTGIIGYFTHRPGTPLPENATHNRDRRAAYARQIDAAKLDNARRRAAVLERIRSGTPLAISREAQ